MSIRKCAILYSGGTDSTCVAYLAAQEYDEIHLLTMTEASTLSSPIPLENIAKLEREFPNTKFVRGVFSVDRLVGEISYENYLKRLARFGILVLAHPGFSSLAWQATAQKYCQRHGITVLFDGLTRELMHFPGHQDFFVERARRFHAEKGIRYENPVRDWGHPPDLQLSEKLIIDYHGGYLPPHEKEKTTGRFLFEKKFFESPNLKGSKHDQGMQHDCYPFITYNVMVFWVYLNLFSWERLTRSLKALFDVKFSWIEERIGSDGFWNWIDELPAT